MQQPWRGDTFKISSIHINKRPEKILWDPIKCSIPSLSTLGLGPQRFLLINHIYFINLYNFYKAGWGGASLDSPAKFCPDLSIHPGYSALLFPNRLFENIFGSDFLDFALLVKFRCCLIDSKAFIFIYTKQSYVKLNFMQALD